MSSLDDPRVFFAAERTLLAWVRSGLGSMGLGVVAAKSGLLQQAAGAGAAAAWRLQVATLAGVVLVLLGCLACLLAATQFRRFVATLSPAELPPHWQRSLPGLYAWSSILAGALLLLVVLV